jgi:membrane-bound lytic murein transglycosylase B
VIRRVRPLVVAGLVLALAACGTTADGSSAGGGAPTTESAGGAEDADGSTTTTTSPDTAVEAASTGGPVPELADDPAALAEQIEQAERAVRDPATPADELADMAHLQQVAYRELALRPDWQDAVVDALPEDLRSAARQQLTARQAFVSMNTSPPTEVPAWRIVPPEPADALLGYYQEAEDEFGVEWEYLAAINLVETGIGRIRGDSSAGAQGPMQFIPSTWERFGEGDVRDPHDAIQAAARYLAHNGGADGNISGALWNYNNHTRYVEGVMVYAQIMKDDPQTFAGFHQWQIWYASASGDVLLPEGYHLTEPQPAAQYVADHPERLR